MKGWYSTLARWALAAVFGYAGWEKLKDPTAFADGIDAYRLLPPVLISLVALGLPILELFTATVLVLNRPRRLGALAATAMAGVFTLALASALARGIEIDCGCFGLQPGSAPSAWMAFSRAAILLVAASVLYLLGLLAAEPVPPLRLDNDPPDDAD